VVELELVDQEVVVDFLLPLVQVILLLLVLHKEILEELQAPLMDIEAVEVVVELLLLVQIHVVELVVMEVQEHQIQF
tara:strand:- start:174 stop:404 length:231 start_codon:yes stop_codon:yes gene_type:complete